jgi:hypothetical protein
VWVKNYWRRSRNGLAPIQVFNAVLSPPFSAAKNSRPALSLTAVRRDAQTSSLAGFFRAGFPQGRLEKAKPSTVAAAVSGPSPSFLAPQNGRKPKIIIRLLLPLETGGEGIKLAIKIKKHRGLTFDNPSLKLIFPNIFISEN